MSKYKLRINPDGTLVWYRSDVCHRVDGPAVIYPSGYQHWYVNDKLHRVDGPAVIYADGSQFYYLEGESLVKHKFNRRMLAKRSKV